MTAIDPDSSGCRLQDLLLVADCDRQALYWRQVDAVGKLRDDADARTVHPFHRLRFDTFINAFYERYWRDLTDLRTLRLVVDTSGSCRIRIVRRVAGESEAVLADTDARGDHVRSALTVSLASLPARDAIIYAEIEALEHGAVLHKGTWLTDAPPHNEVRLAIVICSFARETLLVENLRSMASTIAQVEQICSLLIVRQGGVDLTMFDPYQQLSTDPAFAKKLRLLKQDNFGGTGGFVRGILESLDADATHVVLLDDDVRIEPAVVERLAALLGYLSSPTTVGGQMLDLHRPTVLHASHEAVDFRRLRLRNPLRDTDLTRPAAIDVFGTRHVSDYNAWWFCCIPASTFRAVGLPLPMFIRHDDVEYGVRTIASGAPLVTMPGLFIWHAPFRFKNVTPSFVYYERRNFLIAGAMHDTPRPFWSALHHWRDAWTGLRRHRYDYCWAVCRAVDDYLQGPKVMFSGIRERHNLLHADQARFTLLTMTRLRKRANGPGGPSMARVLLLPWMARRGAEASFTTMFWYLVVAIGRTTLALVWRGRSVAATYRCEVATVTSPAFWRDLLELPPSPDIRS